ncbi:MAG: MATE family efflux transporter [Ruminococcaceae bacterium]|nr:MATE family efflux transporter [Oscillospiraceae bacterium]
MGKFKNGLTTSSILEGSIWDKILLFALPLAATSILQQLFNSADIAVVGRFAGKQALGAVGSNSSLINLLINIFIGLSAGANVVIARFIGQGNRKSINDAVHTAVTIALISGFFVAFVGFFAARPLLKLVSTPDDIIDLSTLYLKIYFLGMPFIMLYNFCAAILRSVGDTKRPLFCLAISGVVNVILNLFFVIGLNLSVAGVAIATVISNAISSVLLLYFLTKEDGVLHLDIKKLRLDKDVLKEIAKIGIPSGLQGMVFSFSNVCIQTAVNSLGSDVVSASSAALNLENYIYFLLNAFSQAAVTFVSQNFGANNLERCKKVTRIALSMSLLCTVIVCTLFVTFGHPLLKIFTTDKTVIDLALIRMKYTVTLAFINCIMDLMSGVMRGYGYSLVPAIVSIVGVCGLRLLWIYTIFPTHKTLASLMLVYPVSQAITATCHCVTYVLLRRKLVKQAKMAQ